MHISRGEHVNSRLSERKKLQFSCMRVRLSRLLPTRITFLAVILVVQNSDNSWLILEKEFSSKRVILAYKRMWGFSLDCKTIFARILFSPLSPRNVLLAYTRIVILDGWKFNTYKCQLLQELLFWTLSYARFHWAISRFVGTFFGSFWSIFLIFCHLHHFWAIFGLLGNDKSTASSSDDEFWESSRFASCQVWTAGVLGKRWGPSILWCSCSRILVQCTELMNKRII